MISPAQQQLDEALTAGGHSDSCAAFDGRRCPGPPVCEGVPIPDELYGAVAAEEPKPQRVVSEIRPVPTGPVPVAVMTPGGPVVTLTGPAAQALVEYEAAAKELRSLTEVYERARARFQQANQAFAEAMASR